MRGLEEIETIGVVGAGIMGSGIAQLAATAGFDVEMQDIELEFVDRGIGAIERGLWRLVERGDLDPEAADMAHERIDGTTDLKELAGCDYVIGAVVEELAVKREMFADLDGLVDPDVSLATNTSTLSVTAIAAATDRAELVVGLHLMNLAPVMEGVEVIVGERTIPRPSS